MRISDWSSDVCSSDLEHAGERALAALFTHRCEQIAVGIEFMRLGHQSDAARHLSRAVPLIERGGPQHRLHAALAIVEIRLQQRRRFSCIYAGIIEIRSEERRGGNECVSKCSTMWSSYQ